MTTDLITDVTDPPALRLPRELRLSMDSDWHIGTGAGVPGGVDRSVLRDDDGLPFVPASSLTGVLRETSARVAEALDRTDDGAPGTAWRAWHDWLFGGLSSDGSHAPTRATIAISSARMRPALRSALTREGLADDVTLTRSSTAIDDATGTAADKTLRTIEFARRGTVMVATISLTDQTSSLPHEAAFLLAAAVELTDRLGGKRTRGSGRCALTLDDGADWAAWTEWARTQEPGPPPPAPARPADEEGAGRNSHGTGWESVELRIRTVEPVAVEAERCGNLQTTHLRLPGSMLLPALNERLGSGLGPSIASGDLQIGDALPVGPDDRTARPTPLGWLVPKSAEGDAPITDCLIARPEAGVQLRRVAVPFITISEDAEMQDSAPAGGVARPVGVSTVTDAHAVIDRATGRPTSDSGGLFVRQAIRPGTTFSTTVRWRAGLLDGGTVADTLEGRWRVGTARRSGYGAVDVTVTGAPDATDASPTVPPLDTGSTIIAEVASDVLLRDDRLRWDPSPVALARALSIGQWGFTPVDSGPGSDTAATAVVRRDGWHAGWSLPRPSLGGLAAGSRVVMRCDSVGSTDELAELLARGLGERVAEGFGRVHLSGLHQVAASMAATEEPHQADVVDVGHTLAGDRLRLESTDAALLATVRRAAVRRQVQLALHSARLDGMTASSPGASQRGALRNVGTALALDPSNTSLQRARAWLDGLNQTEARRRKWSDQTLAAIRALLDEPDRVWQAIGVTTPPEIDGPLNRETLGWYLAAVAKNGGAS